MRQRLGRLRDIRRGDRHVARCSQRVGCARLGGSPSEIGGDGRGHAGGRVRGRTGESVACGGGVAERGGGDAAVGHQDAVRPGKAGADGVLVERAGVVLVAAAGEGEVAIADPASGGDRGDGVREPIAVETALIALLHPTVLDVVEADQRRRAGRCGVNTRAKLIGGQRSPVGAEELDSLLVSPLGGRGGGRSDDRVEQPGGGERGRVAGRAGRAGEARRAAS